MAWRQLPRCNPFPPGTALFNLFDLHDPNFQRWRKMTPGSFISGEQFWFWFIEEDT